MKKEISFGRFCRALFHVAIQFAALLYVIYDWKNGSGVFLATVTFGDSAAPSDIIMYFDALMSQSISNHKKGLTDNIGNGNAFINKLLKSNYYEGEDGGTFFEENVLYEINTMESYNGSDELQIKAIDGVTKTVWEWSQLATSCTYTGREVIQNKRKLDDLVKTKIKQMEMGIQEGFSRDFMQGSGDGALATPRVNPANNSVSVEPLAKLVAYDPTATLSVGNIPQQTYAWWRNITKTSAATTTNGLLQEWMNIFNSCSIKTGGQPDICLVDQVTYELCSMTLWAKYRQVSSDQNFPFTNIKIPFGNGNSLLVMDDKVPDVESGVTSTATYGTMYLLNSKFFNCHYIKGRDFEMLTDENGKAFAKPFNQDTRVGHCAWMGQFTTNQRRKHGVLGKIARTLTIS